MKVIKRMEAARLGLLRFYTGRPCKAGHIAERYTVNGGCVECAIAANKTYTASLKRTMREAREAA